MRASRSISVNPSSCFGDFDLERLLTGAEVLAGLDRLKDLIGLGDRFMPIRGAESSGDAIGVEKICGDFLGDGRGEAFGDGRGEAFGDVRGEAFGDRRV